MREHGVTHMTERPSAPSQHKSGICGGSFPNQAALKGHSAIAHAM